LPDPRFGSTAHERLGSLKAARDRLRRSFHEAQACQTKYAGDKEMF
jgi:hypothetical protein